MIIIFFKMKNDIETRLDLRSSDKNGLNRVGRIVMQIETDNFFFYI